MQFLRLHQRLNPLSLEVNPKSALAVRHQQGCKRVCRPLFHCSSRIHSFPFSASQSRRGTLPLTQARSEHAEPCTLSTSPKQGKQACQGAERASLKVTAVAGVTLHQLLQQMLFGNAADLAQGCTPSRQSAEAAQVSQTCLCAAVPVRDVQSQLAMLGKPSCCASMPTQTQSREEHGSVSASCPAKAMLNRGWHEHPQRECQ